MTVGIIIGIASTIGLEFIVLWILKRKLSGGATSAMSPKELLRGKDKWDGRYLVYRSDGKAIDSKAKFFLMKFDEPKQDPERQALQLYAELISEVDPEMCKRIKTAIREIRDKSILEPKGK